MSDTLPDLPPLARFLPRQDEVDACRELLLADDRGAVAITAPSPIALRGMGGVGKSVLANAVARDPKIRERFHDGIFWVSVGQDGAGQEAKALALQADLGFQLGAAPDIRSAQKGKEHLRRFLVDKACLIVLDDVWDIRDAQRLDVAGLRSRILLTTRDGSLVNDLAAKEYPLGLLGEDLAATLLEKWSGKPVRGDVAALDVVRECGCLPLALAICGAMARDGIPWADIAFELRTTEVLSRSRPGIDPHYETILKSIQASVNFLAKAEAMAVESYLRLAVFGPDRQVQEGVVTMFWQETARCSESKARFWLSTFERKSLLNLEGQTPHRRVSLHDLHHDYIRQSHSVLCLHHELVNAYRPKCPGGWSGGPDDGYFFQHLPYHLSQAGLGDELRGLLLSFHWLAAKLKATDIVQLIADFDLAPAEDAIILLRDALRLSAHYLARDPTLLRSQLHGRLLGVDSASIRFLLQDTRYHSPWLRCVIPSLTTPGGGLIHTLEGHGDVVSAAAMSSDSRRVISGSWDKTLKVWDLTTGKLHHTLKGHTGGVNAVAISGDGTRAVSGSDDSTLKVWDLDTGRLLNTLGGHDSGVTAVALTSDGTRAVSSSWDKTLRVWDLGTGRMLRTLKGDIDAVHPTPNDDDDYDDDEELNAVAVSDDGRWAISGSEDATLKFWDVTTGRLLRILRGHVARVNAVAMSGDGTRAVSGSDDASLKVWYLTRSRLRTLAGHDDRVTAVAMSGDVKWAVSGSDDTTLKVWYLKTGRLLRTLEGHDAGVTAVALSSDGTWAVSGSTDKTLKVWDLGKGRRLRKLEGHGNEVNAVAMSGDGRRAVSGSDDIPLKVWDLNTGMLLRTVGEHEGGVIAVAMNDDGTRAVSDSWDKTLKVWDLDTGELLRTLGGHDIAVTTVAMNGDSTRAVAGSLDTTLKCWDLTTGKLLHTLEGHTGGVNAVAINAAGTRAVSGSDDANLKVWDLNTGSLLRTFSGHDFRVTAVATSGDGRRAVSGSTDKTVKVWDLDTGRLLRTLAGHDSGVTAVAMSGDGRRAVSGSTDKTLKIWDLGTGGVVATFVADYPLLCCACSLGGEGLVAGDSAGRVHLLRLEGNGLGT